MSLLVTTILLMVIGAVCSYYAQLRGRDPYAWFFIGAIFGLLGLLTLFVLPKLEVETTIEKKESSSSEAVIDPSLPLEPDPTSKEWFCIDKLYAQRGPLTFDEIQKLWDSQLLDRESFVWYDGMEKWQQIKEVTLLNSLYDEWKNK